LSKCSGGDHEDRSVAISLALIPELAKRLEDLLGQEHDRRGGRSWEPFIAGASYEGVPTTAFRVLEMRRLTT
jgi:hypothetical protein